ncbi:MAG: peptidyl-tRNA hydrolase Pth2 [Nanoarchaeota archaeon]|nr:peptidyl-tRNA hydrolase Pth2 [Nanoarchaeota archaeon]
MKQVIIVRKDLKMPLGKSVSQASHASVECVLKSDENTIVEWKNAGCKKVVLKVDNLKELLKYKDLAKKNKLKYALIKDAGKTFFKKATVTCLGIGPDDENKIDLISGKLKML